MPPMIVDWPQLLEELQISGLSFRELAAQVDVSHSTLISYRNGTTAPSHANGERLIERWIEVTGKMRAALPRVLVVGNSTSLSA